MCFRRSGPSLKVAGVCLGGITSVRCKEGKREAGEIGLINLW
jgi:hypothetical protein